MPSNLLIQRLLPQEFTDIQFNILKALASHYSNSNSTFKRINSSRKLKNIPIMPELHEKGWMSALEIQKSAGFKSSKQNLYAELDKLIKLKKLIEKKKICYQDVRGRKHNMLMYQLKKHHFTMCSVWINMVEYIRKKYGDSNDGKYFQEMKELGKQPYFDEIKIYAFQKKIYENLLGQVKEELGLIKGYLKNLKKQMEVSNKK